MPFQRQLEEPPSAGAHLLECLLPRGPTRGAVIRRPHSLTGGGPEASVPYHPAAGLHRVHRQRVEGWGTGGFPELASEVACHRFYGVLLLAPAGPDTAEQGRLSSLDTRRQGPRGPPWGVDTQVRLPKSGCQLPD